MIVDDASYIYLYNPQIVQGMQPRTWRATPSVVTRPSASTTLSLTQ